MTKCLDREPSVSAYYIRMTILSSLGGITNRIVNRTELSGPTQVRMAAALAERLAASDLQHALNGERCVGTIRFLAPLGREQALLTKPKSVAPLFTLPVYGDLLELEMLGYNKCYHRCWRVRTTGYFWTVNGCK